MTRSVLAWIVTAACLLSCTSVTAADDRPIIHTLVICSYNGTINADIEYYQFALDYVNTNLTGLNLTFQLAAEFKCALGEFQGSAIRKFAEGYLTRPNKALLFGPAYSNQAVTLANLAQYYFLPEIAVSTPSPELSNKEFFKYFSRVSVSQSLFLHGGMQILQRYNWATVGLLTSDYDGVYATSVQLEKLLPLYNITLAARGVYTTDPTAALHRMKSMDVRIFLVVRAASVETVKFECLIKQLDMVGPKYFWIQLGVTRTFDPPTESSQCDSQEQLKAGAEGSVYFRSDLMVLGNETSLGSVTSGELYREFLKSNPHLDPDNVSLSNLGIRMDAVLTAALALNRTLLRYAYSTELDLDESPFKNQLLGEIRAVDFLGFTGRVKLDGNGDRLANAVIFQIRNFESVAVALYDTYANAIDWGEGLQFSGDGPPKDQPKLVKKQLVVSRTNAIVMLCLCSAGVALTLSCMAVNIRYRHIKLIKMSSPNINNLIGVGCIFCYLSCTVSAVEGSWTQDVVACWLRSSSLCVGYSIAYGAMLAKTWRVHVIFATRNMRRVSIQDYQLAAVPLALVVLDVVLFVVWALVDPMQLLNVKYAVVESIREGSIEVNMAQTCYSNFVTIWLVIFVGYKGFVLAFGIFFAWETRAVHIESLNDSKKIGICVYNTLVMGALGVVMAFVLPGSEVNLRFLLINGCIIVCCTTALIIVFGSKILLLMKHGPARIEDSGSLQTGNQSPSGMRTVTNPAAATARSAKGTEGRNSSSQA